MQGQSIRLPLVRCRRNSYGPQECLSTGKKGFNLKYGVKYRQVSVSESNQSDHLRYNSNNR